MKDGIFLSVVMPAYNEEAHIEAVIEEHLGAISQLADSLADWEIVCLDDASGDATASVVDRLARSTDKVRLIRHPEHKGIFKSFTYLSLDSPGTHICSTGPGGEWPASNLLKMFAALQTGADLVVGVRQNRNAIYSLRRRLVSHAFNMIAKLFFGVATRDAGSIKLGRRDIFNCNIISRSPFAEAERIIRAQKQGYRIDFVPITFLPRAGGKASGAKASNIIASVWDCLRLLCGANFDHDVDRYHPGRV